MLPPNELPAKLVLVESGGVIVIRGGDGGISSLRVQVHPGRQYACSCDGVVVVGICNIGEGQ